MHIFDCQRLVCGQIIWLNDPAQRPSPCGRTIIWGLEAKDRNEWDGGSILDPNDGKTYRLSAVYEPDGTLRYRVWSLEGAERTLRFDNRHRKVEPTRD